MKILDLEKISLEPAKSNPKIKKKEFVKKGEIPHVNSIGQVVLKVGNIASEHIHENSFEAFLIENGTGIIKVNGKVEQIKAGNFILIEPGEAHEILNTGTENLVITYLEIEKK